MAGPVFTEIEATLGPADAMVWVEEVLVLLLLLWLLPPPHASEEDNAEHAPKIRNFLRFFIGCPRRARSLATYREYRPCQQTNGDVRHFAPLIQAARS